MSERTKITHDQAAEAVDGMDDCAKMDVSVDPIGTRTTLELYIAQQRELGDRAAQVSAPDLLSSTQMLLDVLDELAGECDAVAEFQAPIRMARMAVAKATGNG